MRAGSRKTQHEEEEESAFVSMTDMTVSFLFIIILLLAFFASRYNETDNVPRKELIAERELRLKAEARIQDLERQIELKETRIRELQELVKRLRAEIADQIQEIARLKRELEALKQQLQIQSELRARIRELEELVKRLEAKIEVQTREIAELKKEIEELRRKLEIADPLEAYLASAALIRREILNRLKSQLKIDFPDLKVEVSEQSDALRFQGEGLFAKGKKDLRPDSIKIVTNVAKRLGEILPCYTLGPHTNWKPSCNSAGVVIEALQIEGHTDSDGKPSINIPLSTNRANSTFFAMIENERDLIGFKNLRNQPVLSVAGYGAMRPVASNETDSGKATNRRVDLRIIMYTPSRSEEIEKIRTALKEGRPRGEKN